MTRIVQSVDTPHLAYPFQLLGGGARVAVVEQDSPEEVAACVELLMRTPPGARIDSPDMGVPEQTFLQGGADLPQIAQLVSQWEPRALTELSQRPDLLDDMLYRVRIDLKESADA